VKLVLAGGSGQIGTLLARARVDLGDEVVILSRSPAPEQATRGTRSVQWDAVTQGPWSAELDGADAVINLAGRSVNCRYTATNRALMMDSRVDSTTAVGQAIAACRAPPPVWLQMSTATIYAHRFDEPNDDETGIVGGEEPDVPEYWSFSVEIARAWERALDEAETPSTRRVAMRASMVMSPDRGGVFDVLYGMTRLGLGGSIGGGRQYVSWIHEHDFVGVLDRLLSDERCSGPVNVAAPNPLPQREFMTALRAAMGVRVGLPATRWMAEIGAFVIRSDTELLFKSRRVVPSRLLRDGFEFQHPVWPDAARELVLRRRGAV
jgi:uncharacterized protein (TIGR01777 family)